METSEILYFCFFVNFIKLYKNSNISEWKRNMRSATRINIIYF